MEAQKGDEEFKRITNKIEMDFSLLDGFSADEGVSC